MSPFPNHFFQPFIAAVAERCIDIASSVMFAVSEGFGGAHGTGTHFHAKAGDTNSANGTQPLAAMEVGGFFGDESPRGMAEFDTAGLSALTKATLSVRVADISAWSFPAPGGLHGQDALVNATIEVLTYAGNGVEDLTDYTAAATLAGTFAIPGSVNTGDTFTVDVPVGQINTSGFTGVLLRLTPADPLADALVLDNATLEVCTADSGASITITQVIGEVDGTQTINATAIDPNASFATPAGATISVYLDGANWTGNINSQSGWDEESDSVQAGIVLDTTSFTLQDLGKPVRIQFTDALGNVINSGSHPFETPGQDALRSIFGHPKANEFAGAHTWAGSPTWINDDQAWTDGTAIDNSQAHGGGLLLTSTQSVEFAATSTGNIVVAAQVAYQTIDTEVTMNVYVDNALVDEVTLVSEWELPPGDVSKSGQANVFATSGQTIKVEFVPEAFDGETLSATTAPMLRYTNIVQAQPAPPPPATGATNFSWQPEPIVSAITTHTDSAGVVSSGVLESGSWSTASGITGALAQPVRETSDPGAEVFYPIPGVLPPGNYDVRIYVERNGVAGTGNINVTDSGGTNNGVASIDFSGTTDDWVSLGTYHFNGGGIQNVTLQRTAGTIYGTMVEFVATGNTAILPKSHYDIWRGNMPLGSEGRPQPDSATYYEPMQDGRLYFQINQELPTMNASGEFEFTVPSQLQNAHVQLKAGGSVADGWLGGSYLPGGVERDITLEYDIVSDRPTNAQTGTYAIVFQQHPQGVVNNPCLALYLNDGANTGKSRWAIAVRGNTTGAAASYNTDNTYDLGVARQGPVKWRIRQRMDYTGATSLTEVYKDDDEIPILSTTQSNGVNQDNSGNAGVSTTQNFAGVYVSTVNTGSGISLKLKSWKIQEAS